MSHMSSIGKRPTWWTPTRNTIRDVHSSRGTSGQRPPQWKETMAAYHRLITPSSTIATCANYTPHTRPHTVLSIFNCILSPTSSQPLILSPLHHHIYYPQPSFISHYAHPKCLTPNSACFVNTHPHSHLYSCLCQCRPLPPYLCI